MLLKCYVNKWGKEFFESENFNWSCKVHTAEYSIMWWCCGKVNKDAPGWTMSKHESREDEEDDYAIDDNSNKMKHHRWLWCKGRGHLIEQCPKDPNFRIGEDIQKEFRRILKIGGEASLGNSEKILNTSLLLK